MEGVLLRADKLSKEYGATVAAQDVDMELAEGKVHALIGENGAGKSTVIKIITGLVRPNGGSITWRGTVTQLRSPREAQALGIVAVHQELTLVDTLTIAQNIWLGHEATNRINTIDSGALSDRSEELIKSMGLDFDPRATVGGLSLSDKQLVEILKALSFEPKLLILDEATSSLGEKEVDVLYRTVGKLATKGCAILFVSHRMKELFQFCDCCSVMKDGRIVFEDAMANVDERLIINKMTGRELSQSYPPKNAGSHSGKSRLSVRNLRTASGLRDVAFDLHGGEILGLGGLQGHGQVELLKSVFGMERITSGSLSLDGRELRLRGSHDALREGIVLVPEDRKTEGLFIDRTVEENMIACSFKRCTRLGLISRREVRRIVADLIAKMEIKVPSVKEPVRRLSGGNQQKVAIGRWLQSEFKFLVLIEPTRGIDIGTKIEIYGLLRKLAEAGVGIMISTNELIELVGLCDRVLVMFEKAIASELRGSDISERNIASSSFGHTSLERYES
jgi:ribose transport system ATP-binding protein